MNQKRRKVIANILTDLEAISVRIENVQSEEQEALDNTPESLQESDRAVEMQQAIDYLQDALDQLMEVTSSLENI